MKLGELLNEKDNGNLAKLKSEMESLRKEMADARKAGDKELVASIKDDMEHCKAQMDKVRLSKVEKPRDLDKDEDE